MSSKTRPITTEQWRVLYNTYLNQREKTEKYIKRLGGKLRTNSPGQPLKALNFEEFKVDFISEKVDNPRRARKEIAEKLAKDELYSVSEAQAKALAKHNDASVTAIRTGASPLREDVMRRGREIKAEILRECQANNLPPPPDLNKQVQMRISDEFYGGSK